MNTKNCKIYAEILKLLNYSKESTDIIAKILNLVINYTGIKAAGIRLLKDNDYPYQASSGFSKDFIKSENLLCGCSNSGKTGNIAFEKTHSKCLCLNVINETIDNSQPYFSSFGSFWTNSRDSLPSALWKRRCFEEGYESVALIPVKTDGKIIGLLQLNDKRKEQFTPEIIEFLEDIGNAISIAYTWMQKDANISALLKSSKTILEYRDFDEASKIIFNECKNVIGATAGYVALLNENGIENDVLYLNPGNYICKVDPKLPMPIRGLRALAYSTGKAVYDNDFSHSEYINFIPKGHIKLHNVLFAPLIDNGKAVGLLGLGNKPGGFMNQDLETARAFAELASISLLNKNFLKKLETSVQEKEILLKEVHHRVKNNMQVISSLLSLQAVKHKDTKYIEMFNDCLNRIHAMAAIHEILYNSNNFSNIDFRLYVGDISQWLMGAFNKSSEQIRVYPDVKEVKLNIDRAIPCGLIINELVTNSLRYAFPEGTSGEIKINFYRKSRHYELTVNDNGVGLPPGFNLKNTNTLGLKLVSALTDQLKGTLEVKNQGWTEFKVSFPA